MQSGLWVWRAPGVQARSFYLSRPSSSSTSKLRTAADYELISRRIDIELENRKADTRSEQKAYEIAIEVSVHQFDSGSFAQHPRARSLTDRPLSRLQELNNKFTISLGDLRTDIEQYKWESTRKGIGPSSISLLHLILCA